MFVTKMERYHLFLVAIRFLIYEIKASTAEIDEIRGIGGALI